MSNNQKYKDGFPDDNIYESNCPLLYALDIVGKKWKLPIMWYLAQKEKTRYNELKRRIKGITNMMLTKSLKELEEQKLITRTQYESIPPKVEYSLTERGKALLPTLNELSIWGKEQMELNEKI